MRRVLRSLVALSVAACGGAAKPATTTTTTTTTAAAPAKILDDCYLVDDGVVCRFQNDDATAGESCVRVLSANAPRASVNVSDPICSGALDPGSSIEVVGRLPSRPIDDCGGDTALCEVRSVPAGEGEQQADDWRGVLLEERLRTGPPTEELCEQVAANYYTLYVEWSLANTLTEEEKEQTRAYLDEWRAASIAGLVDECLYSYSRQTADCILAATTYEGLYTCWY